MIKISGGKWKGKNIDVPLSAHPTSSRARLAIFSSLQYEIIKKANDINQNVIGLDLFAGSGLLGFEYLSRMKGNKYCCDFTFIEKNHQAVKTIKNNITNLGCDDICKALQEDVIKFLNNTDTCFNIIFADPPYKEFYFIEQFLSIIKSKNLLQGIMVIEVDKKMINEMQDLLKVFNYSLFRKLSIYSNSLIAIIKNN